MIRNEEVFNKIIEPLEIRNIALEVVNSIKNFGYRLIRVKEFKGSIKTLQFMIEKKNLETITISDCTKISKILTDLLEKNLQNNNFYIEVSSPGLERPLIEYSDFIRFTGSKIKIELKEEIKNRVNYLGIIKKCEEGKIQLIQDQTNIKIVFDFNIIKNANLVFEF